MCVLTLAIAYEQIAGPVDAMRTCYFETLIVRIEFLIITREDEVDFSKT